MNMFYTQVVAAAKALRSVYDCMLLLSGRACGHTVLKPLVWEYYNDNDR